MAKKTKDPSKYVTTLNMNGLSGRMLRMPPPKGKMKEILLIAGQHTSIERIFGLGEYLNRYGGVTSPDLPGFGGMEPFYKIGRRPTLDNMADYLVSFIKWRYKNRRLTVIAVSYGFSVVTHMLQRHPEIASKVDLLVSISGIANKKDFKWKRHNITLMHTGSWLLARAIPSFIAQKVAIRGPVIRSLYRVAEQKHPKLKGSATEDKKQRVDFEILLWKTNDFRTWMETCVTMFTLELGGRRVNLPVYHIAVDDDHYFNQLSVEQNMRKVYKDFHLIQTKLPAHAPTILAAPKDVAPFVPPRIRALLRE